MPHALAHLVDRHVVEQDQLGTGGDGLADLSDPVALDLERDATVPSARTAATAASTLPAATTWLSLISAASPSPMRWLTPASASDRVLVEHAQAGDGLAGVPHPGGRDGSGPALR